MEPYDILRSRIVMTPAGEVEISVAMHPGGAVSAIAWLRENGCRVAWLRCGAWARLPRAILIDTDVIGLEMGATMRQVIMEALESLPCPMLPTREAPKGAARDEEGRELRAFQWLLDELGEHYELDELAERVQRCEDVILASAPAHSHPLIRPTPMAPGAWSGGALGSAHA